MLDFSWSELALIGVVALVVIGPKDLPKALRTAGVWVRKARTISREFQSSVEQMMRESELDEVKKQIEGVSSLNIAKKIEKVVDPSGDLAEALKPPEVPDFNKLVNDAGAPPSPPAPPPAEPPAALPSAEAVPAPTLTPPAVVTTPPPVAAAPPLPDESALPEPSRPSTKPPSAP
jgi:sec-independent protein translocase protein TatB